MFESIRSSRFINGTGKVVTGGIAVLAMTVGFVGGRAVTPVSAQGSGSPVHESRTTPSLSGEPASYSGIVDRIAPTVVTVRIEKKVLAASMTLPESLRYFFGRNLPGGLEAPREYRQGGLGSGVVIREDGYVLTNQHVVADAARVWIELADQRSFEAAVIGMDAASDIAVLKIDARELPTIPFGNSDKVKVGDPVLAFGNPLGIGQTVTMGIVSAKGRTTGAGDGGYEDFIQTDAPINQGNSGGALVNLQGELVGINAQILSPSGGNIGLGFAIPSAMAQTVSAQLMQDGVVHRSKLGVTVQPLTAELASSLGLTDARGALVSDVESDSPAARAGLRQGDVIIGLDDHSTSDANSLRNQIASIRPGSAVSLRVLRDGRERSVSARLVERETRTDAAAKRSEGSQHGKSAPGTAGESTQGHPPRVRVEGSHRGTHRSTRAGAPDERRQECLRGPQPRT